MKKIIILASAVAALATTPAMAAGEGRVEGRAGLAWAGGSDDFIAGVAAGYDFDLGETVFAGPEVAYDTNFDGFDGINLGGRIGVKAAANTKLYLAAGYDVGDLDEFNAGVGVQQAFGNKVYGKVEYRRYFFNGTDLNAAVVGIGVKF
jgi:outer membrane immunogenic protein